MPRIGRYCLSLACCERPIFVLLLWLKYRQKERVRSAPFGKSEETLEKAGNQKRVQSTVFVLNKSAPCLSGIEKMRQFRLPNVSSGR
jgi:hypothetical protein